MAKSLYSALFDWIVFRINHALLNVKDLVETTKVGPRPQGQTESTTARDVLDAFGLITNDAARMVLTTLSGLGFQMVPVLDE